MTAGRCFKNRSKFQAPENASIARFQVLGCYQSRSEKSPSQPVCLAAFQKLRRCASAARRRQRGGGQTAKVESQSQTAAAAALLRFGISCWRSFFRSKFQAQKTPPSHGLTGLAAMNKGASQRGGEEAAAWLPVGAASVVWRGLAWFHAAPGDVFTAAFRARESAAGCCGGRC